MDWQKSTLFRQWRVRPRLFIAVAVALLVWLVLPSASISHAVTRALIAWNTGAILYVLTAAVMMGRSTQRSMCRRAELQDDGQWVILLLVVVAAVASLVAIAGELAVVKDLHGALRSVHIAIAGVTVLSSWAFTQVMFTLHYAHEYYAAAARGCPPGLQFPDEPAPSYGDFFYFSAVIGTSGQTADVSFSSRRMRRFGTIHCILAYLFNTVVLALLINIAAGVF